MLVLTVNMSRPDLPSLLNDIASQREMDFDGSGGLSGTGVETETSTKGNDTEAGTSLYYASAGFQLSLHEDPAVKSLSPRFALFLNNVAE